MTQTTEEHNGEAGQERDRFKLHIDRNDFKVTTPTISGQQLRQLPNPPIGDDRDLYEEIRGGEDKLIAITDVVILREEGVTSFFTSPTHVTPGA